MYTLMNKEKEVMQFELVEGLLGHSYKIISQNREMLPYGFTTVEEWLRNRKGSKHNAHLKELMEMCGCEDDIGYIQVTHAASLNDTYWVKSDREDITWDRVSLYKNEFNEQISKLAFEGLGLYGIQMSSTSPELSTEGSFRKCWKRENESVYLYKRGQSGAINAGLEPYGEVMASELIQHICTDAIPYELVVLHKEHASKCKLFTDESIGYVPYSRLGKENSANAMLEFYSTIGCEEQFRQMLVADAIIFNVDRHAGNHGVLINNETKEILRISPVFDLNLSLLPYVMNDEFSSIGDKMLQYGPRIGEDFTRIGQLSLTTEIRRNLINIKGFEFTFRGDDKFSPERVKFLEMMIEKQIEALLSREKLFTKDVFVPHIGQEPTNPIKDEAILDKQEKLAQRLIEKLKGWEFIENCFIEDDGTRLAVIAYIGNHAEIEISMNSFKMKTLLDGIEVDTKDCSVNQKIPNLIKAYETIKKAVAQLGEESDSEENARGSACSKKRFNSKMKGENVLLADMLQDIEQ